MNLYLILILYHVRYYDLLYMCWGKIQISNENKRKWNVHSLGSKSEWRTDSEKKKNILPLSTIYMVRLLSDCLPRQQIFRKTPTLPYYFYIKWLTMFFKTRWRFSVISHRRSKGEAPEMRDDWETSSSFRKHL